MSVIYACRIVGRGLTGKGTYGNRDMVLDPSSLSPAILHNYGYKAPPPLVLVTIDDDENI